MVEQISMERSEKLSKLHEKYNVITYDERYGPYIEDEIAERDKKANCQRYVRDAIEAYFGVSLPSTYLSNEIFNCLGGLFDKIELGDEIAGDIFLLGPPIDPVKLNPKSLHLTFFEGEYEGENNPLLRHFHGNAKKTGLKNYSLDKFQDRIHVKDYGKVWGIRRIIPENILSFDISLLPTNEEVMAYFDRVKS